MQEDQTAPRPPVIWARPERKARGPQPSLTRDQIARAAIEIADAEGIEAVSMRKVAAKVGAGTMSLYRYVSRKDDLIDLMGDAVVAELDLPETPSGDWRADTVEIAKRNRALYLRHPWAVTLGLARPSLGPNQLRVLEYALRVLDGLGLGIDDIMGIGATLSAFVRGFVQAELAEVEAQRRTGMNEDEWRLTMRPYVESLLESGRYPMLTRLIVEGTDPDLDVAFQQGVNRILDGLLLGLGIEPSSGAAPRSRPSKTAPAGRRSVGS
jgi:AcrR family transcriptional regulator